VYNESAIVSELRQSIGSRHFADTILKCVRSGATDQQPIRISKVWLQITPTDLETEMTKPPGMTVRLYAHTEVETKHGDISTPTSSKPDTHLQGNPMPGMPFMLKAKAERHGSGWYVPVGEISISDWPEAQHPTAAVLESRDWTHLSELKTDT
jgi:hypothetical protein